MLLDAAAFVPANRLDLDAVQPDFVSISFYKMFGYPTGVGCLLARRDALARLARPWFAGGTVNFATCRRGRTCSRPARPGSRTARSISCRSRRWRSGCGTWSGRASERIATRVQCLTGWLLQELLALKHANGRSLVRIVRADDDHRCAAVS